MAVKPSGRRRPAGKVATQRVVVAAAEDELHRVDAQRGRRPRAAARRSRTRRLDVDRDPGGVGDVPGVGEQPVGDVDHRGRAGVRGHLPGGVRRLRTPVGLDQHPR